ncbi:MAG: tetratricopeptide repeat protein [Desulfonatronovibrio sp.]
MRHFIIVFFVFCLLVSTSSAALCSELENQESFHEWLRQYGAMDVYAKSIKKRQSGPQAQLDYAEALISLKDPGQALTALNSIEDHQDPMVEGRKFWIKHKALRQMEQFDQAVLAVIESSGFLGMEKTAQLMKEEPDLDTLWSNVWKRWFFNTLSIDQINDGRRMIMEQSVVLARSAWPDNKLWNTIEIPLTSTESTKNRPSSDHINIARALALWSIANWDLAEASLTEISSPDPQSFFENFAEFLKTSDLETWTPNSETSKSSGFIHAYSDHLQKYALDDFRLSSPETGSWKPFLAEIKQLEPESALQMIKQELSYALLPAEVRGRLQALAFIYELQKEEPSKALDSWEKALSNSSELPFTLYLAASLLMQDYAPMNDLPSSRYVFLKEILNAAGLNLDQKHLSEFWETKENNIDDLYSVFPLDYAINFLFYNESFQTEQDQAAAENIAFLFPYSETGQNAYLSLAQHAYEQGDKTMAWKYLQNISQEFARGPRQLDLLEAKAGILMDMGREEESLATYQVILEKSPQRLIPERRLKLALLAQEKNQWNLAQDMLAELWQERADLAEPVQAEILFWLGEGSQHQGDMEEALDYYLRLAWQFPDQNIWAVTAMYRAGLIYEERGFLDTARNLFESVLKNADRDSQKEAAQQRLDTIKSRMGSDTAKDAYLF